MINYAAQGYIEDEARKPTFIKLISSSPATVKLLASNQILKVGMPNHFKNVLNREFLQH